MAQENTWTHMAKPPSVHAVPLATKVIPGPYVLIFNSHFHVRRASEVGLEY